MIKDSARPSYWVPDAESPHCFICKTVFGHSKELELELAHKVNNKNSSSSSSSSGSNLTPHVAGITIDVRRHHCRRCGQAICSGCSKSRMPVPERGWIMEVRVCDSCACVPRASTASNGSNSISSAISDAINGDESAHEQQHSQPYTDDNRRRRSSSSGDHRNGNAPAGQHAANNDKNDNDNCNSVTIWSKCSGKR